MSQPVTDIRTRNEAFCSALEMRGSPMEKKAVDAATFFTRSKIREDGYTRKIMPPITLGKGEFDKALRHAKPVKIIEMEPESPGAITLPLANLPIVEYIRVKRYQCGFARIASPRFVKDVDELLACDMDIRQVLSDNSTKDLHTEEDRKFTAAANACMGGAQGAIPTTTGVAQWQAISGGWDRGNLQEAFKIMPRTPAHLEVATVLVNNVSIREVQKFPRNELGGDRAQDIIFDGWKYDVFMGAKWLTTIKRDLVPDDSIYMFADPKFIGKNFLIEDVTMYVERKAWMVEWWTWLFGGGAIGNCAGIARADFE
jgi:hypothetical protein